MKPSDGSVHLLLYVYAEHGLDWNELFSVVELTWKQAAEKRADTSDFSTGVK